MSCTQVIESRILEKNMKLNNYFVLLIVMLSVISITLSPVFISPKSLDIPQVHKTVDENFYNNIEVEISPNFIQTDSLDGSQIVLGESKFPTVLIVLAHWCPHCRNEVREIATFFSDYSDEQGEIIIDGVRFMSLVTSIKNDRSNFPPHEWLINENWVLPTLVDNQSSDISSALRVRSFPSYIIFDRYGYIIGMIPGRIEKQGIKNLIQQINNTVGKENL